YSNRTTVHEQGSGRSGYALIDFIFHATGIDSCWSFNLRLTGCSRAFQAESVLSDWLKPGLQPPNGALRGHYGEDWRWFPDLIARRGWLGSSAASPQRSNPGTPGGSLRST